MGRYSRPLAPRFLEFAGVAAGMRVLDVGCGPGALTASLVAVLGAGGVAACDPSAQAVAACRASLPGVDARCAPAEELPWPDGAFDAALAQLAVNFMADARAGAAEMRRCVRPGGVLAACTWDLDGGMVMLSVFWAAASELEPGLAGDEQRMRYVRRSELVELWRSARLEEVQSAELVVEAPYEGFDDFWESLSLGVGPAGAYLAALDAGAQAELRERCRRRLGDPKDAFRLPARACAVRGRRPAA